MCLPTYPSEVPSYSYVSHSHRISELLGHQKERFTYYSPTQVWNSPGGEGQLPSYCSCIVSPISLHLVSFDLLRLQLKEPFPWWFGCSTNGHSSPTGLSTLPISLLFSTFWTASFTFQRTREYTFSFESYRHFQLIVIKLILCKV